MFLPIESLNLLEPYMDKSAFLRALNNFSLTVVHSMLFNMLAILLYSMVLCALYQRRMRFGRCLLAAFVYALLSQGVVFAVNLTRPAWISFHYEDILVAPPPYLIPVMYLLFRYSLDIDGATSVATAAKLYPIILADCVLYYMLEALGFFLLSDNPAHMLVVLFFANAALALVNVLLAWLVLGIIRRRQLWIDAIKFQKSVDQRVGKTLIRRTCQHAMLWIVIVPTLVLLGFCEIILLPEMMMFVLILVCLLVLVVSYQTDKQRIARMDLDHQTQHVHALISSIDNIRTIKHDMNNMLSVYDAYVRMGEWDKLLQYHASLMSETRYAEDLLDVNTQRALDPVLRGLLTDKAARAHAQGVYINIAIDADTDGISIEPLDLARMVGILLDNAIEETVGARSKTILFSLQPLEGRVLLSISNPTAHDVDVKRIMERNYTQKPGHSGLGLHTLWAIVSRTARCRLNVEYLNNVITFYLELPLGA